MMIDAAEKLRVAAERGDLKAVKRFLKAGGEINAQGHHYGITPLMAAAKGGHSEVLNYLLEAGADIHTRDKGGNTALMDAA